MNRLYPLKFNPIFKEKIWGGHKIKTSLNLDFAPLKNCGEAWVLSGIEGNQSVVSNGYFAGNELTELIEVFMDDLIGEKVYQEYGYEFPILIKFIDANAYLSIQVHPNDELAALRHQGSGKSEMWYIIEAEKGSELITGFQQEVDRDLFISHLRNKTLKNVLNIEQVKTGDVFYLPAGRIHALGPGILLAEIQQTSDITYRIYDWDRVDDRGHSRELHVAMALDAIDFKKPENFRTYYNKKINSPIGLVNTPDFTTNLIHLKNAVSRDYHFIDSFVIFLCLEGGLSIDYKDGKEQLNIGEAMLIPAMLKELVLEPVKESRILEVYIE